MKNTYLVDTNILVRLLSKDDDQQFQTLIQLMLQGEIRYFIPSITLIETFWVLKSTYSLPKDQIVRGLFLLIESDEVELEEPVLMRNVLHQFNQKNVDLADAYIAEKAKQFPLPVLTWNHKDFKKLECEYYAPGDLV